MGPSDAAEVQVEKPWETMNIDERLDRLRNVIEQLYQLIQAQSNQISTLRNTLGDHVHDETGKPYIKKSLNQKSLEEESMIYNTRPYGMKNATGSLIR